MSTWLSIWTQREVAVKYLVDSCAWIDFWGKKAHFNAISDFLRTDFVCTNSIILAELLPSAQLNHETEFIACLSGISVLPLDIDWNEVTAIQYRCLKSGINKLGLLDIAIAQNAVQHGVTVFSSDGHMLALAKIMGFSCRTD
jgi:predicted nucleic acid-binding protein